MMESISKLEKLEAEYHDSLYKNSFPFNSTDLSININETVEWLDYCYKKDRRLDYGHRTKRVFELIDLKLLPGKRILDAGCGNGQYSVLFAMLGAKVWGCDISPCGIKRAKRIAETNNVYHDCQFSVQNLSNLSYQDNFFDLVFMHEVLHHAYKYPGIKQEIFRITKKGGTVICSQEHRGNKLFDIARSITMKGEEQRGALILDQSDLDNFSDIFSSKRIEMMSLFFMAKRILKNYMNYSIVRAFLRLARMIDGITFTIFPQMKRYCGECILILKK